MTDEAKLTEELEDAAGGPEQAFRLMRLYTQCCQAASGNRFTLQKRPDAQSLFLERAQAAGFSRKAALLLLLLQQV